MRYSEMITAPNDGITTVVELTWDRRDRGGPWLVVERGHITERGYSVWGSTGRLVATGSTPYGARNRAGKARAKLDRLGVSGRIDVVPRQEVEIITSTQPYGCYSGEVTA